MQNLIKIGQMVADILRFNWFQNGSCLPSWIFEIHFEWSEWLRDPFCINVPNFVKIGQTIAEISRFLRFLRWRPPPFWIFKKSKFLETVAVGDHRTSTRQISSNSVKRLQRYGDLTVFKIAAVRHLRFVKFNFLTIGAVKRPILHQHTKFHQSRSKDGRDMAISQFF